MNVIPHTVKKHYGSKTSALAWSTQKSICLCKKEPQLVKLSTELNMSVHVLPRSPSQMGKNVLKGLNPLLLQLST